MQLGKHSCKMLLQQSKLWMMWSWDYSSLMAGYSMGRAGKGSGLDHLC